MAATSDNIVWECEENRKPQRRERNRRLLALDGDSDIGLFRISVAWVTWRLASTL